MTKKNIQKAKKSILPKTISLFLAPIFTYFPKITGQHLTRTILNTFPYSSEWTRPNYPVIGSFLHYMGLQKSQERPPSNGRSESKPGFQVRNRNKDSGRFYASYSEMLLQFVLAFCNMWNWYWRGFRIGCLLCMVVRVRVFAVLEVCVGGW